MPVDLAKLWVEKNDVLLCRAFSWLTRTGMGPYFGTRPLHYYRQHQCAALDVLESRLMGGRTDKPDSMLVRVRDGVVQGKVTGERRWRWLGVSAAEVYRLADKSY